MGTVYLPCHSVVALRLSHARLSTSFVDELSSTPAFSDEHEEKDVKKTRVRNIRQLRDREFRRNSFCARRQFFVAVGERHVSCDIESFVETYFVP